MSTEFKREERYIVFKVSDLGNSLKGDEIRQLAREYAEQRRLKGKPPLECVVVESDWPEYDLVWDMIESRMTKGQNHPEDDSLIADIKLCMDMADGGACDRGWLYGDQLDSAIDSFIEMLEAAPEAKP